MSEIEKGRKIERVEDLPLFRVFYQLAIEVFSVVKEYPRDNLWLTIQTNKAAEAVPANWTEGFYSQYSTEYLQCLYRCRREGREAQLYLRYASDVGLVEKSEPSRYWNATKTP